MTSANHDALAGGEPDPVEAIAAALGRLRGRGRGPHGPGPHGHDLPHEAPGRHGGRRGGSHGSHAGAHGGLHEVPGRDRGDGPRVGRGGWRSPWGGDPAGRHGAPAVFRMLEALAKEDLSVSALGEAIGVDQPRASRLVQQGVEHGWVRREADPDDARRTRIALTDEGGKLVRGVRGQRRELLGQALEVFSAQERTELARLLTKLADNWPA